MVEIQQAAKPHARLARQSQLVLVWPPCRDQQGGQVGASGCNAKEYMGGGGAPSIVEYESRKTLIEEEDCPNRSLYTGNSRSTVPQYETTGRRGFQLLFQPSGTHQTFITVYKLYINCN